jgi:glutamyl-tRNA synthetase
LLDSGFEDWKKSNPSLPYSDYHFDFSRMPKSGALFDLKKLDSVSNIYLSGLSNETLFEEMLAWANEFRPELLQKILAEKQLAFEAVSIQRGTERDPKKFTKLSDVEHYLAPFLHDSFDELRKNHPIASLPFEPELITQILKEYLQGYDNKMDSEAWLGWMRERASKCNFARDNAEFKLG